MPRQNCNSMAVFAVTVYSVFTNPMEWRDLVVMVEGIREDPSARLRRLRAERTEYHV